MVRKNIFGCGARLIFVFLAAVLGLGCQHAGSGRLIEQRRPLLSGLESTLWAQTAAEHAAICSGIYTSAQPFLLQNIANKAFTALPIQENGSDISVKDPAVIFDLDETLLDNSRFQGETLLRGVNFDEKLWKQWVLKEEAPALPGAVELLEFIRSKGAHVIYITNRGAGTNVVEKEAEREATVRNLTAVGFPVETGSILLPGDAEGKATNSGNKSSRRELVAQKYRVVALFGDDLGDFTGIEGLDVEGRMKIVLANSKRWGFSWFILPNPMYGSWLRVLTKTMRGNPYEIQSKKLELIKGINP